MANEGRENNANWDGIWDVATSVVETGWVAEIRIPFRTLKFNDNESQTWGVNFDGSFEGSTKTATGRRFRASTTSGLPTGALMPVSM